MIRRTLAQKRSGELAPFDALIEPFSPEAFFDEIWGREIFYVEGSDHPISPVMEHEHFFQALFEAGLGAKDIRFTHPSIDGEERALDHFFRIKAAWQEAPDAEQLAREIPGGTLVIDKVDLRVPQARAWCQKIFSATGCTTCINAYFGAGGGASAFGAHCDAQDVFVMQVGGEKDWLLWDSAAALEEGMDLKERARSVPADHTVRLRRGDVLYVPKGTWHWPKTIDVGPSFHLTVSLEPPTSKDALHWLSHTLSQTPLAEARLPFSRLQSEKPSENEDLARAMALLRSQLAAPDAAKSATAYIAARNLRWMHTRTKN